MPFDVEISKLAFKPNGIVRFEYLELLSLLEVLTFVSAFVMFCHL